jgi:hypothetical protein
VSASTKRHLLLTATTIAVAVLLGACTKSGSAAGKDAPPPKASVPSTTGEVSSIAAPVATAVVTTAAPAITALPTSGVPTTTTAPSTTAAPPPPAPNPCSGVDFRNFTFDLPEFGKVTIVNGQGERGILNSADYAALQVRAVVAGDFGGVDGNAETAVFTNVNTGGTGQFSDVHIYSCAGTTATRLVSAGAGDRADGGVRGISITSNTLYIDRFTDAQGACCPTAAVRQGFKLSGGSLTPTGEAAKRKYLSLDASAGEVPISFLPGTSGAVFFGDTATGSTGGFDAGAGQTLTLVLEPPYPGNGKVILDIVTGTKILGSVESGATKSLPIPAKGHYALKPRPGTAGADASYDGEMTIT